jgi:hypothetical protein
VARPCCKPQTCHPESDAATTDAAGHLHCVVHQHACTALCISMPARRRSAAAAEASNQRQCGRVWGTGCRLPAVWGLQGRAPLQPRPCYKAHCKVRRPQMKSCVALARLALQLDVLQPLWREDSAYIILCNGCIAMCVSHHLRAPTDPLPKDGVGLSLVVYTQWAQVIPFGCLRLQVLHDCCTSPVIVLFTLLSICYCCGESQGAPLSWYVMHNISKSLYHIVRQGFEY